MKAKQFFLGILSLLAWLTSFTANAYDAYIDGIYYNFSGTEATVTYETTEGYNSYSGDIVIPETVAYNATIYRVTCIGVCAFCNCYDLTSITIPNSVTSIEDGAFSKCHRIASITIPNSVTSIGGGAFSNCWALTSITIPESVTSIGIAVLDACSGLNSIVVESGNSVYDSRNNCNAIIKSESNELISGCQNTVIPESVTTIVGWAFDDCTGLTSIVIPNSVTSIGLYAFSGCTGLTSVVIPNSVTTIDMWAFSGCYGLTSVAIPNSVTSIGKAAFYACRSLTSVVSFILEPFYFGEEAFIGIPDNCALKVPYGKKNAYIANGWTTDVFKGGIEEIDTRFTSSFNSNGLEWHFEFDNGEITFLDPYDDGEGGVYSCLYGTSDSNIPYDLVIPSTVSLFSIDFPVVSIGWNAFCNMEYAPDLNKIISIVIPEGVRTLGDWSFCSLRNLQNINIPSSVTTIGYQVFSDCRSLTSITIPESVSSISDNVFAGCTSLTSVVSNIQEPFAFGLNAFRNISSTCVLTVPNGTRDAYIAAGWTENVFKGGVVEETAPSTNIVFADANVKALCVANWDSNEDGELSYAEAAAVTDLGEVFKSNRNITSFDELQYFTGLTSINYEAFYDCSGLTSVIIPNSVTEIDQNAFRECSSLTSINIPDGVTSIYSNAFSNCSALPSITIPNSVTGISSGAFYGCSALTKAEFSSIEDICGMVFGSSSANPLSYSHHLYINGEEVTEVVIPDGVTSINYYAFSGCSGLTSVTIPSSVTSIRDNAFANCTGLSSVTIPAGVTSVGPYVFRGCTNLKSAIVRATDLDFWTFLESGIETLTIGSEVLRIRQVSGSSTVQFPFTNLKQLVIEDGDNNLSIDGYPFNGDGLYYSPFCESSLETIYLGRNIIGDYPPMSLWFGKALTLGGNGFYYYVDNDKLTSLSIGNKVTQIPEKMCGGCIGLTSISIPNSVTSIGSYAFQGCSSLTSISIPNSVTSIGSYAFGSCNSLTNVTVDLRTPLSISSGTFSNRANATLIVPVGSKAAYQAADYWKEFKRIVEDIYGDVNGDEEVDVVDVVDIVRYAIDNPSEAFVPILADINSSGEVNVGDAVSLVNIIAGDQNFAKAMRAPSRVEASDEALTLMSSGNGLSLCLENERSYTAFQFDLFVPEGTDVAQMLLNAQRKQKHQLLYNKVEEGHYRVAAISTSNHTFQGNDGELLSFALNSDSDSDIAIRNIHFFDTEGKDFTFEALYMNYGAETGISSIENEIVNGKSSNGKSIYDLQGRRRATLQRGLNIVNGKKVLIK